MIILTEQKGDLLRLECIGKFDAVAAPVFREEVSKTDLSQFSKVVLDFENVPYISSAGLRELLIVKKKLGAGAPLHVENVSEEVFDIFEATGFADFLELERPNTEADLCAMSFGTFLAYKAEQDVGRPIFTSGGKQYTWGDINANAAVIAEELYKLGVRKGAHVALCGTNSANWVFTFYAIQKLGAIALLMNPQLTETEIAKFAEIGDVKYLCYGEMPMIPEMSADMREIFINAGVEKFMSIRSDIDFSERAAPAIDHYEAAVHPDDACVMVFTSGSTGLPKGALLSAYNILSAACSNVESLHLTAEDKACLILPMFHIFGLVTGLFACAAADAEMIIPENLRADTVIRTVYENRCTVLHAVPTFFLALLRDRSFDPEKLGTLRSTILGGASTSEAHMRRFAELLPNNRFASSYGMSEIAPISITDYGDTLDHLCHTVGRPVKNVQVRIYDNASGRVCAPGQVGEIQVQGSNLMTCYYKADLEKQSINADGWMSTGDLGAFDEDGYLRFVGRLKELIIRGGENIVPNEVISALCAEDCVADARVFGVPDDFYGEKVAAAIVLSDPENYKRSRLYKSLALKLAGFKMPDWFIVYESFPLLPNGKVDAVKLKNEIIDKCTKK